MPQVSVKERLVQHAEDVFRRRGFNGASVQDITTAAGVPKGSFYNHFVSKDALAAEIVRRYAAATDLRVLSDDKRSPVQRLRAHFKAQAKRTAATGVEFGCLWGTMAADSPTMGDQARTSIQQGMSTWTEAVAGAVRAGQEEGEITSTRPATELAALLIDAFEGGALRAKASGERPSGHIDTLLDLLSR
jgi:TetR/AcrR family transcriptional regulator, transcriptional repressor for nem operon